MANNFTVVVLSPNSTCRPIVVGFDTIASACAFKSEYQKRHPGVRLEVEPVYTADDLIRMEEDDESEPSNFYGSGTSDREDFHSDG